MKDFSSWLILKEFNDELESFNILNENVEEGNIKGIIDKFKNLIPNSKSSLEKELSKVAKSITSGNILPVLTNEKTKQKQNLQNKLSKLKQLSSSIGGITSKAIQGFGGVLGKIGSLLWTIIKPLVNWFYKLLKYSLKRTIIPEESEAVRHYIGLAFLSILAGGVLSFAMSAPVLSGVVAALGYRFLDRLFVNLMDQQFMKGEDNLFEWKIDEITTLTLAKPNDPELNGFSNSTPYRPLKFKKDHDLYVKKNPSKEQLKFLSY